LQKIERTLYHFGTGFFIMEFLQPTYENELINELGYTRVIGIDEVGRGCWAGPVAVGAFIYEQNHVVIDSVQDSKKLSEKRRDDVFSQITTASYDIIYASPAQIDKFGLNIAIETLILKIIAKYQDSDTFFLIDGQFKSNFVLNSQKVLRGDSKYYSIGLASIAAKVARDRKMKLLGKEHPTYGFESHKGYGTKKHKESLEKFGILKGIHRVSYKPIQKIINDSKKHNKK
jgi:ribonuclease HII